jgi:hypothetical protein
MNKIVDVVKSGARLAGGLLATLRAKRPLQRPVGPVSVDDLAAMGCGKAIHIESLKGVTSVTMVRVVAPESLVRFLSARDELIGKDHELRELAVRLVQAPAPMDVALYVLSSVRRQAKNDFPAAIARMEQAESLFKRAGDLFSEDGHITSAADDAALRGVVFRKIAGELVKLPAFPVAIEEATHLLTRGVDSLLNSQLGAARLRQVMGSIPDVIAELRVYEAYQSALAPASTDKAFERGRDAAIELVCKSRQESPSPSDAIQGIGAEALTGLKASLHGASFGSNAPELLSWVRQMPQETAGSIMLEAIQLLRGGAVPHQSTHNPIWRRQAVLLLAFWRDQVDATLATTTL